MCTTTAKSIKMSTTTDIIIIIKYREKGIMPVSPAHYNQDTR